MSARLGNPAQVTIASAALGAAAGRVIALNNNSWLLLIALSLLYTASGTGGNRQVAVDVKDSGGNLLFRAATSVAITTTQVARINVGNITSSSITAPLVQNISLPCDMPLPPNATLTVVDTANVDTADTVAGTVLVSA